jgi:peroxiredoxin family protein
MLSSRMLSSGTLSSGMLSSGMLSCGMTVPILFIYWKLDSLQKHGTCGVNGAFF